MITAEQAAWINFFCLLAITVLFQFFYIRSVAPAGRELTGDLKSYDHCFRDRTFAMFFEGFILIDYVVFIYYPLQTPLPLTFQWDYIFSVVLGLIIGIPAMFLMTVGMLQAGVESVKPKKEHTMYKGIYNMIRHPQATGEVFLFFVIALFLNSPFLALYSLIYFPIFILLCFAEEQDLLIRYGAEYAQYCHNTGAFWPKKR